MTKEAKYGLLGLIGLLIVVPAVFLIIKLGVLLLGAMFNYPATVLAASVAFVVGIFIGEKLK